MSFFLDLFVLENRGKEFYVIRMKKKLLIYEKFGYMF